MIERGPFDLDELPSGCFVTNASLEVTFFNKYLVNLLGWSSSQATSLDLENIMTRASQIFCESYVYPLLIEKRECNEVQLTFLGNGKERVPVVVSAKRASDGRTIWSVFCAQNRDKMFEELITARNALDDQTEHLKVLSTTDELTGLLNRRACNDFAKRAFEQASRDGTPVSIVLLDIDDFKRINDTYGHNIGDVALREMGEGLSRICHSDAAVARFGGEEFIAIMDGAKNSDALAMCECIHAHVATILKGICPVTVSIGVATRSGYFGPNFDELLTQADNALYQAKTNGKNTTVIGGIIGVPLDS